jgi:hypothetical protein
MAAGSRERIAPARRLGGFRAPRHPSSAKHAETPLAPLGSLVSFPSPTLRCAFWRGRFSATPLPHAGGQSRRSAPLTAGRNSRASRFELAALDRLKSGPPAPAGAALILCLSQFVFRSSLSRFSVSRPHQPAFAGGKNRWCPLKTTPTAPPCFTGFLGEGRETETEQRTKKRP